jgi:hypothetical protein
MDGLVFLLVAFVLIVVGCGVVLLRAREPKGDAHGIKEFQGQMRALSPDARKVVTPQAPDAPEPDEG